MTKRSILKIDGSGIKASVTAALNFRTKNRQRDRAPLDNAVVHWREVFWMTVALAAFAAAVMWVKPARGAETLPGPIPAEVVRVVDGDTLRVRAHIWPGHTVMCWCGSMASTRRS